MKRKRKSSLPPWSRPVPGEEQLLTSLLPLARRAAVAYARRSRGARSTDEAYSDALLALLEAIRLHDVARGPLEVRAAVLARARIIDGVRKACMVPRRALRRGVQPPMPLDTDVVDVRVLDDADDTREWDALMDSIRELRGYGCSVHVTPEGVVQLSLFPREDTPMLPEGDQDPVRGVSVQTAKVLARMATLKARAAAWRASRRK